MYIKRTVRRQKLFSPTSSRINYIGVAAVYQFNYSPYTHTIIMAKLLLYTAMFVLSFGFPKFHTNLRTRGRAYAAQ